MKGPPKKGTGTSRKDGEGSVEGWGDPAKADCEPFSVGSLLEDGGADVRELFDNQDPAKIAAVHRRLLAIAGEYAAERGLGDFLKLLAESLSLLPAEKFRIAESLVEGRIADSIFGELVEILAEEAADVRETQERLRREKPEN